MTTAHLFYIPVILFVGIAVGFVLGQRAAEEDQRRRRKKLARRRALKNKKSRHLQETKKAHGDPEDPEAKTVLEGEKSAGAQNDSDTPPPT